MVNARVNSIPEMELMGNSNSKSGIAYLKKNELKLINLEFATKKLNPQIDLPIPFLIQKYFYKKWNWNW